MPNLERSGDDWDAAGSELRRLDPLLYLEILTLAKSAVTSHRDPLRLRAEGAQVVSLRRSGSRGSA